MKNILICVFLIFYVVAFSQESPSTLQWTTNLQEAKDIAKQQNKAILVYFTGSDWCSPCQMLKKDFFETPEFRKKANDMVLVMIDCPRRIDLITQQQLAYNKTIIAKYNKENAYPKIIAMNSDGKILGKISGYSSLRDPSGYFAFLEKYLL